MTVSLCSAGAAPAPTPSARSPRNARAAIARLAADDACPNLNGSSDSFSEASPPHRYAARTGCQSRRRSGRARPKASDRGDVPLRLVEAKCRRDGGVGLGVLAVRSLHLGEREPDAGSCTWSQSLRLGNLDCAPGQLERFGELAALRGEPPPGGEAEEGVDLALGRLGLGRPAGRRRGTRPPRPSHPGHSREARARRPPAALAPPIPRLSRRAC